MPDLSPPEAVAVLRDALPGNPEHDGPVEAAARVVLESVPVGQPWEERLDPEWFAREGDVALTLRTARGVLDRVHHPDTGMYGLLSALVINLEAMRETAADALQLAARIATDTGTRTPLDELMAKHGITQADLDALPDDPTAAPDPEGAAQ